jgi:hypothetical protein
VKHASISTGDRKMMLNNRREIPVIRIFPYPRSRENFRPIASLNDAFRAIRAGILRHAMRDRYFVRMQLFREARRLTLLRKTAIGEQRPQRA